MTSELWSRWSLAGLGELSYALELLLGAIAAAMGCVGVVLCLFGRNGRTETVFVDRVDSRPNDHLRETVISERSGQVTIRLEPEHHCLFRRRRWVVTIREAMKDAGEADQEVWYARDDG